MYILLIFTLLILLIINNKILGTNLLTPSNLFCGVFLISAVYGVFWIFKWDLDNFSLSAYLAIVLGCVSFSVATWIIHNIFLKANKGEYKYGSLIKVSIWKWVLIVLFEIYTIILCINFFGGSLSNISQEIMDYRYTIISGGYDAMPSYLSLMINICLVNGYISGYALVNNIISSSKLMIKWLIIYLLSLVITLFGGSRGGAISVIVATIVIFLTLLQKKYNYNQNKEKLRKIMITLIIILIIGVLLFIQSAYWIGRTIENSSMYYLAIYLSAPLKNLDFNILDINNGITTSINTFRSVGNYSLGNVGTIFTSEYINGGYLAIVLSSFSVGLISAIFYEIIEHKNIDSRLFSLNILIYGFIMYVISMSVFGNTLIINYAVKVLIGMIIMLTFYSIDFKKGKIIVRGYM